MPTLARRRSIDSSDESDAQSSYASTLTSAQKSSRATSVSGIPLQGQDANLAPLQMSATQPPSGYRVPLMGSSVFPSQQLTKEPVSLSADGSPFFIGSALFSNSVQPCSISPRLSPPCRVPYGGKEIQHAARYDLLPFDRETMEFVPTSLGRIPHGRKPVDGGYEDNGAKLYHALATVKGTKIPGKTGEHLGGCHISWEDTEKVITRGYDILCWKQ